MKIEIETWDTSEQRGAEKLRDRIVGLNLIAELIILPSGIRDKRNAILHECLGVSYADGPFSHLASHD